MCGRYGLTHDLDELVEVFEVPVPSFEWAPRYNIAPTQPAPVVAEDRQGRRMGLMRWGLIPYWAGDPRIGNRHINARVETAAARPAFKDSFVRRRCLVPASGFYEWARAGRHKRPHWIHAGGDLLAFAGVWDRWRPRDGKTLHTFAILTTEASGELRAVHDRMPVLVRPADRADWLDRDADPADLHALLRSHAEELQVHEVSTWVNAPDHDDPSCIEPVA